MSDNTFTVVHRPRACHTNADSLSRRPGASEISESSEEERALVVMETENDSKFECPFCKDVTLSQDTLDHHVDTCHVSGKPLSFTEWQSLQKVKKNKLHVLFNSDPEVLSQADIPVAIKPWRYSSQPRINDDDSISYSWSQWLFFSKARSST